MKLKTLVGTLVVAGLMVPGMALATNGYFSHGYGMTAKGMGGASTAMAKDTFGGANNPASMVFVGDRLDVGVDWFRPIRGAERTGSATGINFTSDSGSNDFAVPEFGYNMMMGSKMSLGVTVYGNGGMNTDYAGGEIANPVPTGANIGPMCNAFQSMAGLTNANTSNNALCGNGKLGIDLIQLVIAPTVAYKVNENNSIGVSPLLGYQRFKAEGLQGFSAYSSDMSKLTNNGYDSAYGFGVRIGYMGKLNNMITVGAAYSTKIDMSKFDKYKGLFAEQGDFDMPENWNLGIAIKPTPATTVALDYQRINYSGVKSVGNSSRTACDGVMTAACMGGIANTLGGDNGRGFGYGDVDVVKLGAEYAYSEKLTLRAGYSRTNNPISPSDVTFNIIAPAVIQDHYTLGFTYALDKASEITMSYMHAQENSVSGETLFSAWTPVTSGQDKIKMYQDTLGIAYGKKF